MDTEVGTRGATNISLTLVHEAKPKAEIEFAVPPYLQPAVYVSLRSQ